MELKSRKAKSLDDGSPDTQPYSLSWLDAAEKEGRKGLTDEQYLHLVHLFDDLANEVDPKAPTRLDVERIEDFFELREKGGIFGNINVRVYFDVCEKDRTIVVLCYRKKEEEGKPSRATIVCVRNRARYVRAKMGVGRKHLM